MHACPGRTAVIDTADWRLIVPLRTSLNLSGTRLQATMTPAFGGPPAAKIDSDDGTISWVADPVTGLSDAVIVIVLVAERGSWRAAGPGGQPVPITVAFDVHRTVTGSDADEWLGRSSVLVLPATDSELVRAGAGTEPVLISKQPEGGVLLPALQTGPQGPGLPLPAFDPIADEGKSFCLKVVNGALVWAVLATVVLGLVGASTGASSAHAALSSPAALAGAGVSQSAAVAGLTTERRLAGAVTASGSASGTIAGPSLPFSAAVSSSQAAADLVVARQLQGASHSSAAATADLFVPRALAGASLGATQASGILATALTLSGTAVGASSAAGALTVAHQIQGAASSAAGVTGDLTSPKLLAAAATAGSVASGTLSSGQGTVQPATTGVLGDGDSIMRGYGLPSPTTQNMLAQYASISGKPIFNSGSDGDTLANINSTWSSSGHAARYSAGSLNTYLLEGGGADLRAGTSDATCRTNCQGIIAQAKAAGFICFVSTVLPQGTASAGWTSAADAQRVSYNAWLKANYASFADGIVDLAGVPEATDPNSTTYYQDGIHPTAALATILGQAIANAVGASAGAQLAGTSTGVASVTGGLTVQRQLAATTTGSCTATGTLAAAGMSGTSVGTSTVVGTLTTSSGGAVTQWSATDKDPSVTKTSATRVDRASTAGSTNGTIRSATSKASGRRYVEWKVEATSSNNQGLLVGFALGTEAVSNYLGQTNKSVGMWSSGSTVIFNGGANNTGFGNFAVGDIISADLNIDAGTVRFAKNNAWGGVINISALTSAGPVFVGATMLNVSPLTGTTANFGDSAFVYTPPSGAVAWNVA